MQRLEQPSRLFLQCPRAPPQMLWLRKQGSRRSEMPSSSEKAKPSLPIKLRRGIPCFFNVTYMSSILVSLILYSMVLMPVYGLFMLPLPLLIVPPSSCTLLLTKRWSLTSSTRAVTSAHARDRRSRPSLAPSSLHRCLGSPSQASIEQYTTSRTLIPLTPLYVLLIPPLMRIRTHAPGVPLRQSCHTVFKLPEGSQAAIRDVAEAYRTIPILPDQWPGLVVRLVDDNQFAINVCNNFGLTSAGGIYGLPSDATLDIFRAQGIGPISKWVDDHIFFRIPVQHLASYNASHRRWHATIMRNGDRHQTGSRFWYQGEHMPDDSPAEFDEDAAHPIWSFSHLPNRSPFDSLFTYCDSEIDDISGQLGIPWEPSKTIPFSYVVPYLGFEWDLSERTVAIPERKKTKYKAAIKAPSAFRTINPNL